MYKLIHGKSLEYKGYRLVCSEQEFKQKKSSRLGKFVKVVSPMGDVVEIKNISEFCRNNNINRNNFQCLLKKRIKSYQGWKSYE